MKSEHLGALTGLVHGAADDGLALPANDDLLARWKQDVATWPGPALLADSDQRVIAANCHAADAGVTEGQPFLQALAALTRHVDQLGQRRGAAVPLRVLPASGADFAGWFVDAAGVLPLDTDAERAISQRLADSNLRLQEEIRRRRFLERQMLTVAEQEKRRISLELHDGLGQHLTGVSFVARALADAVRDGKPLEAREVDWLARLVTEAIARTRGLSRGLWPVSLERGSLGESIGKLAEDLESMFGISCEVLVYDEPQVPSQLAAHHIFRVMQEAANNAVRHGRARRLQFRLQADGDAFEISLGNDGLQLDREQLANPAGIGVAGMRLRADSLGGSLAIEPRPGGGAEVTLRLPGMAGRRAEDGGIHE